MHEVPVGPRPHAAFRGVADAADLYRYEQLVGRVRARLGGRPLWHVNSSAAGGGVAELLGSTLGYLRDAGIDARWLVLEGDPGFFDVTKRIHNRLHGSLGDGGPLGELEREHVDRVTAANLQVARRLVSPGDVVVVHDPQPLGLVPGLTELGAVVIWTSHVGVDVPNDLCRSAWEFLHPYLDGARALTFTRQAYVWEGLEGRLVELIPPCIDAFSLKNADLDERRRDAILAAAGVVAPTGSGRPTFVRGDGARATVVHRATVVEDAPVPPDARLVVQVSRWDRLKDPLGVIAGFADAVSTIDAHLILAGPAPSSVADDPEAIQILDEVERAWEQLRPGVRPRVHLANLPTDDVEENAVIVNALQRRAQVVVQKSLAEGFGLTVTEAMWKRRAIVASRVGGIQDQIVDGEHGLLIDPRDLTSFGNAVTRLLDDAELARHLGDAARERVRQRYLAPEYLASYLALIDRLDV
ncbi:MAG TPA: glycosyltransferase [Actinomycetota bacterium]